MDVAQETGALTLKSVIYATDFSTGSERAGRFASLLARQFGAELLVAHAFTPSQAAMEVEAEGGTGAKSAQRRDLEGALTALAGRLGEGLERATPVLVGGDPEGQIPRLAQEHEPSMIVLGTRGRSRFERGIVGSTADGILRSTDGPTLTVGPQVPELGDGGFKRVLFATDLAPAAARGARYAAGMARAFHACLDALHVVHPEVMRDEARLSEIRKRFCATLKGVAPQDAEDLCNPKEYIEAGSAQERILAHVREHGVDLLVLSVQKSSHLWLRGRISGVFTIIANAACPVMTLAG
ncbi:MAG TPA: universal stress protein [Terracidiphilus sp.]|nr:universal stress protein [Terracidiphilus sp.]